MSGGWAARSARVRRISEDEISSVMAPWSSTKLFGRSFGISYPGRSMRRNWQCVHSFSPAFATPGASQSRIDDSRSAPMTKRNCLLGYS